MLFRILDDEVVSVILNKSSETTLELSRFEEVGLQNKQVKDIITGEVSTWGDNIAINPNGITSVIQPS